MYMLQLNYTRVSTVTQFQATCHFTSPESQNSMWFVQPVVFELQLRFETSALNDLKMTSTLNDQRSPIYIQLPPDIFELQNILRQLQYKPFWDNCTKWLWTFTAHGDTWSPTGFSPWTFIILGLHKCLPYSFDRPNKRPASIPVATDSTVYASGVSLPNLITAVNNEYSVLF